MTVERPARNARPRRPGVFTVLIWLLPLLIAACVDSEPAPPSTSFAPLSYDYLTKLRLNVETITIDDTWVPRGDSVQVGHLAPTPPLDALRQMARDRLVAAGSTGRAVFVIDNASIIRDAGGYHGDLAVHLDVTTSDGTRSGVAEAHVTRERTGGSDDPAQMRAALDEMVRQMMQDMNVEFEYQVRRSLRDYLPRGLPQGSDTPRTGPVETQDLKPPPGVLAAPAPLVAPPLPPPVPAPVPDTSGSPPPDQSPPPGRQQGAPTSLSL